MTFYLFFSVLSLAAYGLVLHDRTASAQRAGRVYIVLAMLGEVALLVAFILADTLSQTLQFGDIRAALATSAWRNAVLAGLLIGFGIKLGLVPAHVWLPLAHPEAPTPASAVLSGIIVEAGVIGFIRFLPLDGAASAGWAGVLIALGLVTAYFGVVVGLMQADAKVILAYSTLSQMGLVVTVLASGMCEGSARTATIDAATLYAAHHGLAKAALFLGVGLAGRSARPSGPVMILTTFTALAIAGLPLSGGALAKLAIKTPLGEGTVAWLVTLSAVGTTMLMLRFLWALTQLPEREPSESRAWGLLIPWFAMAAAAVATPWILFPQLSGHPSAYAAFPANLWAALWPILVALVLLAVPRVDLVAIGEASTRRLASLTHSVETLARGGSTPRVSQTRNILRACDELEQMLQRAPVFGPVLILLAALIALILVVLTPPLG